MFLNVVDNFASARVNHPKANIRLSKPMSSQQFLQRCLDHGTREMLDRRSEHDPQLTLFVLESYFFDLLRIQESLEVNDLRVRAIGLWFRSEQEGSGAVGANRIADYRLESVIDVVACRANFDS